MPDPTRREFVRGVGIAAAGAMAPLLTACETDPTRNWKFRATIDVAALSTDGQGFISSTAGTDGAPILVIRTAPKTFSALSTRCTHEGCPVNPPANGVITCPCHGSQYKLDGTVLHGPAQFPLERYLTRYDEAARRLAVGSTE